MRKCTGAKQAHIPFSKHTDFNWNVVSRTFFANNFSQALDHPRTPTTKLAKQNNILYQRYYKILLIEYMCKLKISQWRVCVCVNFGNVRLVLMFFPFPTSDPRYIGWLIGIFILFLTSGRPSSGRQCNGMHHQRVRRRHKSRHIFPHFLSSSSRGKDTLVSSNSLFPLLFLYLKLTNTSVNRPASTLHAPHTQTHLIVNFPKAFW